MKRSAIQPGKGFKPRTQPMARGTSTLRTTKPLQRGSSQLARTSTLKPGGKLRSRKPASLKPKRAARNAGPDFAGLCRGQPCYLLLPGIHAHALETVVPCHSNQQQHGKGMGIKALDLYTVPGCAACHRELDQGNRFTRAEKFALWDSAYARWEPVRTALLLGM